MGLKQAMAAVLILTAVSAQAGTKFPFNIYTDAKDPGNHSIASGWMGDTTDMTFADTVTQHPHSGKSCIKITYKPEGPAGWAGIFWQTPANNWGSVPKSGFNLTGAKTLSFWARGEKGGEILDKAKVGGITGTYPDSSDRSTDSITLSNQWQRYTIPVDDLDLKYIIGPFCVVFSHDQNPKGATIYLDDIEFLAAETN